MFCFLISKQYLGNSLSLDFGFLISTKKILAVKYTVYLGQFIFWQFYFLCETSLRNPDKPFFILGVLERGG